MRLFYFPFLVITRKEETVTVINDYGSLGHRIKAQRLKVDMTQEQLAEVMCIPKSTISAYENDKVDIKSSVIIELSKLLKTTPNYLLGIYEKDYFSVDVIRMLQGIKDQKIREIILIQIKALASI